MPFTALQRDSLHSPRAAGLCVARSSRRQASIWSAVACTCVVCTTQSWKAGSCRVVGQLGPASSQLLMCWRPGSRLSGAGEMARSSGPRLPLRWAGRRHLPEPSSSLCPREPSGRGPRLSKASHWLPGIKVGLQAGPLVGSVGRGWLGPASVCLIKGTLDLGILPCRFFFFLVQYLLLDKIPYTYSLLLTTVFLLFSWFIVDIYGSQIQ